MTMQAKLRVGIGDVQYARIAETFKIVNARIAIGRLRTDARQAGGKSGGARKRQEIASAEGHADLGAS